MFKSFSQMMFRKKLLISYFVLVILSMFLLMIISSIGMMNTGRQRELESIENVYAQSLLSMDNYMKRYINLAKSLKSDTFLTNFLNKHYPEGTSIEKRYYDYVAIEQTYASRLLYERLSGNIVTIYTGNSELYFSSGELIKRTSEEEHSSSWYQNTLLNQNQFLLSEPIYLDGQQVVPFTVHLSPRKNTENILMVGILIKNLKELLFIQEQSTNFELVNADGVILFSGNSDRIGQRLSEGDNAFLTELLSSSEDENQSLNRNGTFYIIGRICRGTSLSPCYLIGETSLQPAFQILFQNIRPSLIWWLLILLTDILVMLLVTHQFSKRVTLLMNSVQQISAGQRKDFPVLEGSDEFSSLSVYIGNMLSKVSILQKEAYQAKLDTKTAQIRALYSQINPHFLFNCLQAIQTSALKAGAMETSDLVSMYSKMIRESITWTQEVIPLDQELMLIKTYLTIQKKRFDSRLQYEMRLDEDSYCALIPKFTIQPIVENSIHHGMQGCDHALELTIVIRHLGEELFISVQDNGNGIDAEILSKLREMLEGDLFIEPQRHIGILNLQQRIRLLYGREYGIQIESSPEKGTKLTIKLPFRTEDEKAKPAEA